MSLARFIASRGQSCTIRGAEIEIDGKALDETERASLMSAYEAWAVQEQTRSLMEMFSQAIQSHLDNKARERQYDSIHTAVTYRDCTSNAQFAAEGRALQTWRGAVWTYAIAELDKVQNGEREIPTVEAFIAELPAFEWPDASDSR